MGNRFEERLFDEVQSWIDGTGGREHRYAHGHDKESETEIGKKWGDLGVEIFRIHIVADRVHENLAEIVRKEIETIEKENSEFPYFDKDNDSVPYCRQSSPPVALPVSEKKGKNDGRCENCGSTENPTLNGWVRGIICEECIEKRDILVCFQCESLVSGSVARNDPLNPDKPICPVCLKDREDAAENRSEDNANN